MEENIFKRTMIETVKYNDLYDTTIQNNLIKILRRSIITYDKRDGDFTKKPWQSWEYVDVRVPPPLLVEARKIKDTLQSLARDVYIETDSYAFKGLNIKPKAVEPDAEEEIDHDVIFSEIKDMIIQGIRDSKYTIWIAVAWFTDRDIYNELLIKKSKGVNVRIIIADDKGNNSLLHDLETNFEVVKTKRDGTNIHHNKFCIIDLDFVMHGSYNWSFNARKNDETLSTAIDKDYVKKFCDEFINLYLKYN